jgi:Mg2+ and Co2+ transporter CorA
MKVNKLAKSIMFAAAASSFSMTALAESTVEELAERLERMQQEMDELKQHLEKSATKEEVQVIKKDVATAGERLQPDTLIHMAGYADVGYTDSESEDTRYSDLFTRLKCQSGKYRFGSS